MHKGGRERVKNLPGKIARRRITDLLKKRRIDGGYIHEIVLERGRRGRAFLGGPIKFRRRLGSGQASDIATA